MTNNTPDPLLLRFKFCGEDVTVTPSLCKYDNGRLAIEMTEVVLDSNNEWMCREPFGMLTVNLPNHILDDDEHAIKNYSENEEMYLAARSVGWINSPHRNVQSGFVEIPICTLAGDLKAFVERCKNNPE